MTDPAAFDARLLAKVHAEIRRANEIARCIDALCDVLPAIPDLALDEMVRARLRQPGRLQLAARQIAAVAAPVPPPDISKPIGVGQKLVSMGRPWRRDRAAPDGWSRPGPEAA